MLRLELTIMELVGGGTGDTGIQMEVLPTRASDCFTECERLVARMLTAAVGDCTRNQALRVELRRLAGRKVPAGAPLVSEMQEATHDHGPRPAPNGGSMPGRPGPFPTIPQEHAP